MDDNLKKLIQQKVRDVLNEGSKLGTSTKQVLKEALILTPKTFALKTDFLSQMVKETHMKIYKSFVDSFNLISSKLDTVSKADANNPNNSDYRRLRLDEQHNMNGAKLHELYFTNIGDQASEIRVDSTPFLRLSRDWGSFENWQFDFRACGMASIEGWAICYYEPFKQRYLNTFLERNTENIPIMGIPVLVIDTWSHAWFRDHPENKMNYLNAMMKEINWNVVEARMMVAEVSKLSQLYMIAPVINTEPDRMLQNIPTQPPIDNGQIISKLEVK